MTPKPQDAKRDQQENHIATTSFSAQVERGFRFTQGGGVSNGGKRRSRRGQSPRSRGAGANALAVSLDPTLSMPRISALTVSDPETGP
jgi:hypothetical protein